MDWFLLFNLMVLLFGSLVLAHSFFWNWFIKPLIQGFEEAEKEVEA